MSSLTITGKLKRVGDIQQITDNFAKREFVIETDEQYPQTISLELIKDKMSLINEFAEGEVIEVYFNIRGREWQRDSNSEIKVFNTLTAWRIQKPQTSQASSQGAVSSNEDLPF